MKFRHDFKLKEKGNAYRVFEADGTQVRLDFFEHYLRVAVIKDRDSLIPTYTVCPEPCECGREGRDKLSVEGFVPAEPEEIPGEKGVTFKTGEYTASVEYMNFRMTLSDQRGVLYRDREYQAYNFDHEFGRGSVHYVEREKDERIFGLGDKAGNVNKNGMAFKLGASDSMGFDARTSDPLYKQLPFYICENHTGSYGLYYDTYSNGEVTFGKELNQYYESFKGIRCNEENLVFYVIFGTVAEIVTRFSALCGKILFPPEWSLKYCGSTMAYTDAPDSDRQLRGFIDKCEEYGFKPGGFYLSSGYTQIGDRRYVFNWDKSRIPDPEDLARYFKEHGAEFLPNVKPCFLTDHPLYEKIAENGWFLHYENGEPAVFPFWGGFGSYLDFTDPGAFDFWKACVKEQLVDRGYRSVWNDNNEYDVCDESVYAHGWGKPVKACDIRPLFSFLMTMASLSAQKESSGDEPLYTVSRCGIGGLQRIATTWTGDNYTSFEDFRYNHKMAMTMSLSGFYNFGQDIGGFAGPVPSRELFMRWIQYGLFTPRFVLHSWKPGGLVTMPWMYEDLIPNVKRLFDFREAFIPYLYGEIRRSCEIHEPVIYPVFLKYPDYDCESDCFFFGDRVLACPVFDEGRDSVTVTLPFEPEGWYNNGVRYEGTVTLPAPWDGMPVYFTKGPADVI